MVIAALRNDLGNRQMGTAYTYFHENEFRRATPSCSLSQMDAAFMDRLDYARSLAGFPFIINSAYRSIDYELAHNRSGDSAHTRGLAVDIRCDSSLKRIELVKSLLRAGFRRIGIGKTFIHVDDDLSKPKALWIYENS